MSELDDKLIAAVSDGDLATVEELLERGANIHAKGFKGRTTARRHAITL